MAASHFQRSCSLTACCRRRILSPTGADRDGDLVARPEVARRRAHREGSAAAAVLRRSRRVADDRATLFCGTATTSLPSDLRRSGERSDGGNMPVSEQLRWKWLAAISSVHLWATRAGRRSAERHVRIARETGALGELPLALSLRVYAHLFAGELTTAASLLDEIQACDRGDRRQPDARTVRGLAALRGREPEAISLIDESREDVTARRGDRALGARLGSGAPVQRLAVTTRLAWRRFGSPEYPHDLTTSNWGMVGADRGNVSEPGTPELAVDLLTVFAEMARASGRTGPSALARARRRLGGRSASRRSSSVKAIDRSAGRGWRSSRSCKPSCTANG